ncbi:PREDICTED: putative sodium-dependent multivitamin transporter [Vollenhovia emeryi]|uniref:putative sodium-dependent multivitamin transporter n=1 Tax=Vollenhovia emeryi TaxID=411798 RepID=UPI0005F3EB9B|nr:PREDICTED: putative sodium-dependent multivitamin transporter [Vollenhovia emeryi]XP_011880851.1 PREDICTED: putative sodium-dependent multivitamin transporter [Vollenhovia emeryi]
MDTFIEGETNRLQWQDYLVIGAIMSVSVFIGLYYRFSGGRQSTAAEYFSADNSLGVLPLSIAMMASHVSGITMLGMSGESYIRGLIVVLMYTTGIFIVPIIVVLYLPVFFEVKVVSIYEYLEMRFGLHMRLLVSAANFTETMLLTGVMLYAPSLALEATTGLSSTMSILILAVICTFYSTLGGIKAVLITDIFQGLLMLIALSIIIFIVAQNIDGGIGAIWRIAQEGGRLNFSETSFDPTVQYTWWSLLIGGGSIGLAYLAVNQVQVQRLMTVKNVKVATNALFLCGPLILLVGFLTCFAGVSLYALYKDCDPVASGKISTYDKILPYYTVEQLPPGLVGLIVSGVFSASLSTISAMMNSLAAVALEDYVKPLHRKFGIEFSDKKATFTAKALTVLNGVICMFLALIAKTMGTLVAVAFSVHGAIGGPILGIFTLGMVSESANETGTIIGMITALTVCLWATFGKPKPPVPRLPVSIEGCANSTLILAEQIYFNSTVQSDQSSYFYLYRISYLWYNPIGLTITLIVGYLASIIIRLIKGGNNIEHDASLFVPFVAARIRRRRQDAQKTANSQLFVLEPIR